MSGQHASFGVVGSLLEYHGGMPNPHALLGRARGFMEARVLLTAAELDLFTELAANPRRVSELAADLELEARPLRMLLDALVALDLLEKKEGVFSCMPDAGLLLTRDAPESVLAILLHNARLWDSWGSLTSLVRGPGRAVQTRDNAASFIGAMHAISRGQAPALVETIDPGPARNLLDVGGASGTYTEAFLEAVSEMRATLFDLPRVVELARRRLPSVLQPRVRLVAGDLRADALPAGHDLALLSAVIHMLSPDELVPIFRKVHAALLPGGRIVIRDYVMSADRTTPLAGALFAINMLVNTPGGGTYTMREIREALGAAGFERVRLFAPADTMNSLVEAYRPNASSA